MYLRTVELVLAGLLAGQKAIGSPTEFKIDLSQHVPRMLSLINQTQLPDAEEYPGVGESLGIDLGVLKSLQAEWTTSFDWDTEQAALNR